MHLFWLLDAYIWVTVILICHQYQGIFYKICRKRPLPMKSLQEFWLNVPGCRWSCGLCGGKSGSSCYLTKFYLWLPSPLLMTVIPITDYQHPLRLMTPANSSRPTSPKLRSRSPSVAFFTPSCQSTGAHPSFTANILQVMHEQRWTESKSDHFIFRKPRASPASRHFVADRFTERSMFWPPLPGKMQLKRPPSERCLQTLHFHSRPTSVPILLMFPSYFCSRSTYHSFFVSSPFILCWTLYVLFVILCML